MTETNTPIDGRSQIVIHNTDGTINETATAEVRAIDAMSTHMADIKFEDIFSPEGIKNTLAELQRLSPQPVEKPTLWARLKAVPAILWKMVGGR